MLISVRIGSIIEFHGKKFVVSSIFFYETNYSSSIYHLKSNSVEDEIFIYEDDKAFFIGKKPNWFIPDSIDQVISRSDTFIFQGLDNVDSADYDKLELADRFEIDGNVYNQVISYDLVHSDTIITVGFFHSETKVDNPYIFVLWYGIGKDAIIELTCGYTINQRDVRITNPK